MITNYLVLHSTNFEDLLTKVNSASEMGYHIVASASYGLPVHPSYPYPENPLTHYVWMERWVPYGPRYTTVGPGIAVENVLGRPVEQALGVGVVRPGVVQPVARGVLGELSMAGFIKLSVADSGGYKDLFVYLRPECITDMSVQEGYTQVSYESGTGVKSWSVKETPEEIIKLTHDRGVIDMERV